MTIEEFCKPLIDSLHEIIETCNEIRKQHNMVTEDVIKILDNAELLRLEMQERLRTYVNDKSVPLETRFIVWARHCEKHNCPTDSTIIDALAEAGYYVAGYNGVYTYTDVLNHCGYSDEVKELLIRENCKSITVL